MAVHAVLIQIMNHLADDPGLYSGPGPSTKQFQDFIKFLQHEIIAVGAADGWISVFGIAEALYPRTYGVYESRPSPRYSRYSC